MGKYEQKLLRFDLKKQKHKEAYEHIQNKPGRFNSLTSYIVECINSYEGDNEAAVGTRDFHGNGQENISKEELKDLLKKVIREEITFQNIVLDNKDDIIHAPTDEEPGEIDVDESVLSDIADFIGF